MKKMKLFLLAAMIFAAASAFTTVTPRETLYVKGPAGGPTYILESVAISEFNGNCDDEIAEDCTYLSSGGTEDPDSLPGRYVYP